MSSDESLYLLATCYYRASKQVSAYSILSKRQFRSAECSLLLARCCCDLKKYDEAEQTLSGRVKDKKNASLKATLSTEELIAQYGNSASFAAQLLALICSKTERSKQANDYYKRSLKLNPFLWSSFEKLIQLGAKPVSSKIFNISNVDFNLCHGNNPFVPSWNTAEKSDNSIPSQLLSNNLQNNQNQNPITQLLNVSKLTTETPQTRLSFGVFPIGETPPLSNLSNSNLNHHHHDNQSDKSGSDSAAACLVSNANGACTPASSASNANVAANVSVNASNAPSNDLSSHLLSSNTAGGATSVNNSVVRTTASTAISRAPVKKPQTRRTQQSLALGGSNARNLTAKLQLANQLNTQDNFGLISNQCSSSPATNLRRSTRLFNSGSSVKENSSKNSRTDQENSKKSLQSGSKTPSKRIKMAGNQSGTVGSISEFNEFQKQEKQPQPAAMVEQLKQTALKMRKSSAEGLLTLLSSLGEAALAIGQFRCQEAIIILESLPRKHYNSGWVLTALGRAYFELGRYDESVKYFEEARRLEPHTLQGTEYYSTALWHLQREVKLSMLAHELLELDKLSSQTWCVAGNCFSLQKEHETAIKFLQRAIQLDSDFAYAYTLLGHELVLTEEMDQAMSCFRNALRIDSRHYNALYGIGMIYYKQEKFKMAEVQYRKALLISCNPVLMCHLAVVQHALKKPQAALQTLNRAIEMDPKNALCKFHRASIKFSMDEHEQALQELDELKQIVPKESLVYFLIGKVRNFYIFYLKTNT